MALLDGGQHSSPKQPRPQSSPTRARKARRPSNTITRGSMDCPAPEVSAFFQAVEQQVEDMFTRIVAEKAPTPLPAIGVPAIAVPVNSARSADSARSSASEALTARRRASLQRIDDMRARSAQNLVQMPIVSVAPRPSNRRRSMSGDALGAMLDRVAAPAEEAKVDVSQQAQNSLRDLIAKNMKRVTDVFRDLDLDGSGEIDRHEFHKGIRQSLGGQFSDAELDEVFTSIDVSGDGNISIKELQKSLRVRQLQLSGTAPAEAPAEEPSSARGGVTIHPLRLKETYKLYLEFKDQHERGICKVDRFDKLLRLRWPTEDAAHINAMVDYVRALEAEEARAQAERERVMKDSEELFEALDVDKHGAISLDEFLMLRHVAGVSLTVDQLRAFFKSKDVDGSGGLDLDEFKLLVVECSELITLKDAIIAKSKHQRGERVDEKATRQDLWTIGLPKPKAVEVKLDYDDQKKLYSRPSLAGVGVAALNVKRLIRQRELRTAASASEGDVPV